MELEVVLVLKIMEIQQILQQACLFLTVVLEDLPIVHHIRGLVDLEVGVQEEAIQVEGAVDLVEEITEH
jgi:hypothetical protein